MEFNITLGFDKVGNPTGLKLSLINYMTEIAFTGCTINPRIDYACVNCFWRIDTFLHVQAHSMISYSLRESTAKDSFRVSEKT